jgi:hypothetical protein
LLCAAFLIVACDKTPTYEPPPEQRVMQVEAKALEDAKALAVKNDLEGAHTKLTQVNPDAPMRSTKEFREIEDRWASARIAQADAEKDPDKKVSLLQPVQKAISVSPELRAKASNKIDLAYPDPKIPPPLRNYDPALAEANLAKCKELIDAKKYKEAKELLLPRVLGGIASPDEANMLAVLCTHASDDKDCTMRMEDAGVLPAGFNAALAAKDNNPSSPKPKKK